MRYGICSTCQSKHAVTWQRGDYYMANHDYPGTIIHCEGSGQIPETLLGDSRAQQGTGDTDDWDDMAMCQDYWDSWMMGRWSAYGQRQ